MNQNHHITHTEQYHHLVEHHQEDYEYEQDTNTKGNNKRLRIKSHEAASKPKRKRITPYQFSILSDLFANTDTPNYQLRENTAEKLNMTNREVQVWFQNRRAKVNRSRLQEQKRHDPFIYPIYWNPPPANSSSCSSASSSLPTTPPPNYTSDKFYHQFNSNEYSDSSQSSVTTTASSPTLYPQLLPHMRPLDVLALAAEYVQRCDEEKRLTEERRKCWRPWD